MGFGWLILFLIPAVAAGLWARYKLSSTYTWGEFGAQIGLSAVVIVGALFFGLTHNMYDVEIINGEVLSKHREHGSYIRTYSCNCTTQCSGSGETRSCMQVCQTCYENRYTVDWYAKTTVGKIRFDYKDTTSRSVYNSPDPSAYVQCKKGDPASRENRYVNYVKAAPDSLFNTMVEDQPYADKVPRYPKVHSFYKVNRVIPVATNINKEFVTQLNQQLSNELKTLGFQKQVNIIVILTGINDPSYRYTVENTWLGGKKNDVVVFLGIEDNKIVWNDTMTWALNSGNELFAATLNQKVSEIKELDTAQISSTISSVVQKYYDRPEMESFEYLLDSIKIPTSVFVFCFIFSVFGTAILTYIFHRNEVV